MPLRTMIYKSVTLPQYGNGGFRSHPCEIGGSAPSEFVKSGGSREHPVTLTNSGDVQGPQPLVPSHSSILGL
jgi:hypothetical protein